MPHTDSFTRTLCAMIQLYDTAKQKVVPLELRDPGKVSMYVCGPTVGGPPHIGHGRMTLVFDIIRRYLSWSDLDVTFVSNVTDIDDKIIDRAIAENRDSSEIAIKCEAMWWKAMDALNILRPDETPHATAYLTEMVELLGRLVADDKAYATSDGVYLSVETVDGYGLLAHQSLDQLIEGGGDRAVVGTEKRHPGDFALWKLAKEGEPSWPSPWGDGRPGWHTECVAMSLDLLGEGFDIHGGGLDLTFPHHENERAQAIADGKTFVTHWMHNGFVEMDGEKMSKSLGNVTNLLDLVDQFDPRAYRLLVLQSHYRSPIEVTEATMTERGVAMDRLDTFARRTASTDGEADQAVLDQFREAMDNDFDSPAATDLLFRQVREGNSALDAGDDAAVGIIAASVREMAGVFGLELDDGSGADETPADVLEKLAARTDAKAAKDFATADALRDELLADGWIIEDSADGATVRRA